MTNIIDFEKYKYARPRSTKRPEDLENCLVLLLEFLDEGKTQSRYELTGTYGRSKMGRIILAEALMLIAADILQDDPAVILELIDSLSEEILNSGEREQ